MASIGLMNFDSLFQLSFHLNYEMFEHIQVLQSDGIIGTHTNIVNNHLKNLMPFIALLKGFIVPLPAKYGSYLGNLTLVSQS